MFNVNEYLKRLSILDAEKTDTDIVPSLALLDRLILAHQLQIVFENIDICDKHLPISLDRDKLFEKIVVHGRGGYCLELNSLFCALLQALGFDARLCKAKIKADAAGPYMFEHQGIIVELDGKARYVDVGFGGPMPSQSVPFDGTCVSRLGETYWFEQEGSNIVNRGSQDTLMTLKRLRGRGIRDEGDNRSCCNSAAEVPNKSSQVVLVCQVSLAPVDQKYFDALNEHLSLSADSFFRQHRYINVRTLRGYKALTDLRYVERIDDVRRETLLAEAELMGTLREEFGLYV